VLPVFKITCNNTAPPYPFLGRTIYTTDPGRALISGKCADIGSLVMPQLRGLAGRTPFFANGSATTIGDVVDFYDTRFDIKMSRQEKLDLVNFLSTL
jgi:cytochrome c peroxidase